MSLTGFFLLGVSYYIYVLAVNIQKPFAQASEGLDYSSQAYNSTKPANILFINLEDISATNPSVLNLHLLNVNPVDSKTLLVSIPADYNIEDYNGLGNVPISKIFTLNSQTSFDNGLKSLVRTVETTLAININGYVIYDNQTLTLLNSAEIHLTSSDLPKNLNYSDYFKIKQLFEISRKTVKSDLNTLEFIRIIADIKDSGSNFNYKKLDSDNLTVSFDEAWQQGYTYEMVKKERNSVIILNSTSKSGLATWASRYVSNIGGLITELGNSEKVYAKNEIYSTLPPDNQTLGYIMSFFNVSTVKSPDEFTKDPFLAKRADILLVLGEQTVVELY
ncbi:hypothetical protein GW755_00665 [bacterium]|nr:hypothetical protein [bacterium]